jgi:hypothetical protein
MNTETAKEIVALRKERDGLLDELAGSGCVLRGTLLERYSTCTRKECRCHQGERHGPRAYVVVTQQGRQRQHYVPRSQRAHAGAAVGRYHAILKILDRLTEINLQLMRAEALE